MSQPSPLAAALADRYRLEREIGAGGMATVHLATDLKHDRPVAVKVLDPALAASVGAERFLREIRITAGLQHPNILTLIDSGEAGGFLYYVMPFVDGESLRARLARAAGPLPTDEAVRVLREMVDALAHAHRQGLVHRDIKPENVMLTGRHALLLDFGVAKALQSAREGTRARGGSAAGEPVATETLTSVGTSLGTPAYMAPEQAAGDPDVDHRADLYSAGLVAYEMLSGVQAFRGRPHEVLAAQVTTRPTPLGELAPGLPPALVALVMRCLEKDPAKRPASADAMLEALDAAVAVPAAIGPWASLQRRLGTGGARLAAAAVLAVVLGGGWQLMSRNRDARWVREVAVPDMQRLFDATRTDSAFLIAERALAIAPDDSTVRALAGRVSREVVLATEPAGARIAWTAFDDSTGWRDLGVSPVRVRLPNLLVRMRMEGPGIRAAQRALLVGPMRSARIDTIRFQLVAADAPHPEMVLIPGGEAEVTMPGLSNLEPLRLAPYLIDRHEVSNAEYKAFVEAGGYEKAEYWTEPIERGGRTIPLAEARTRFVDRTGRPGPATWEAGDFPPGGAALPVGGVSWYEAMAYAAFAGKSLPTLYHWNRAARTGTMSSVVPSSNFGSTGPRAPGEFAGMNVTGTFDMAGNVREWVLNAFGTQRFILGGGWSDQSYAFVDAYAQDPLDRSAINGIRLALYLPGDSTSPVARAPIAREFRDYTRERPVSEAVYRGLTSIFAYDRVPLDVRVERRDSSNADWTVERVTLAPVYGQERLPVTLFIPRRVAAPLQAVVYFPGSNGFGESAVPGPSNGSNLDAVLKSGRMVVWPSYASMYERPHVIVNDAPNETALYRDHVVMWAKDLHRTLDYLESRGDVDMRRVAYHGHSFGGRVAPIMLAMEPRFRTAVLSVAGLKMERTRPESDPLNYLPHVRIPTLMLNGRFDHYFPLESSQKPYFALLGTAPADKRHVVFDGGHAVPRTMFISETLGWLDKYLGPVPR